MLRKTPTVFSIAVCLFGLACLAGGQPPRQTAEPDKTHPAAEAPPPRVTLKSISAGRLGEPLRFEWEIMNEGAAPIYIYSTLLEASNARLAEPHINQEQKTLDLYFLRLEPLRHAPYNFPEAAFKLLNPGQTMKGTFVSNRPAGQLDYYTVSDHKPDRIQPSPGAWKVRYAVAYGHEIESVKAQLEKLQAQGVEHPINPVVRWQKVAYSNPQEVSFQR